MSNLESLIESLNAYIMENNDDYKVISMVLEESEYISEFNDLILDLNEEQYSYFTRA